MDLMVDSDTNLVNNRGSSHSNRGSMSISDWSSMGNSRSSICGMMSNNRASMGNSRSGIGSMGNGWGSNSMSSRVNTSY